MIRFEILLPLFYNDGRSIEPEKFLATDDEIVQAFGATSTDQVTVHGKWNHQSIVYSDQLIRVRVDVGGYRGESKCDTGSQGDAESTLRTT